jgi:hypothetical protein
LGMQMLIQQQLVSLSIFDLREVIYFLLSIWLSICLLVQDSLYFKHLSPTNLHFHSSKSSSPHTDAWMHTLSYTLQVSLASGTW